MRKEYLNYSPFQFSFFRIGLGSYLVCNFLGMLSSADLLLGRTGIFGAYWNLSPFPSLFHVFPHPAQTQALLLFYGLTAFLFSVGLFRRLSAIILWYGWASLSNIVTHFTVPSEGYIGWLLLASVFVPLGEPFSLDPAKDENWKMPRLLILGAWLILAFGYSFSGIDKLKVVSWNNGQALDLMLQSPYARSNLLTKTYFMLPQELRYLMSWFFLYLEVLFAPLAALGFSRKWIWTLGVFMHVSVLLVLRIPFVSMAFLLVHLFIYDPKWFRFPRITQFLKYYRIKVWSQ